MDVVITGRRVEVAERFRYAVQEKVAKVEHLAPRSHRMDVELSSERNPRQSHTKRKVEITVRGGGPVLRAEASGEDSLVALDLAMNKLEEQLRRAHDKRRVHHGRHTPESVRYDTRLTSELLLPQQQNQAADDEAEDEVDPYQPPEKNPMVIRIKDHAASPMTLDQALYQMELVGHDFYLYIDAECGRPAVVYRRKGWNYGVIRLDRMDESQTPAQDENHDELAHS